ncbi:microtubule-associated tumor suppressor 1 homolog isoform X2 [Parambassis ranga]|uniref:Microtubule-associated tumor suppressor 1 homolog isoform X2 n=1 Tax=Parambassis ranga TaxID=210632 RepID=A0A6P7HQJ4_9TELE|nr:microtubule-associated tumor suppressor 1 homolog isoform X2 [Parambassis ranga]
MSVPESFPVRGKSASSMKLALRSAGDHNGNAFPISSSSSSSSSSCLGESSPESLRSLSSLSGGRTDSPLDYDMFEVTLMTTVMTKTQTDIVVTKWTPEEESEDASAEKVQTELSESNDNSVSVYLDANSQDTWNDNLTLALSLGDNHGNSNDVSCGSSNGRRHGSSTSDSEATEIPADEDDDEEEALFVSVSSDVGMRESSVALTVNTGELRTEPLTCPEADPPAPEELRGSPPVPRPPPNGQHTEQKFTANKPNSALKTKAAAPKMAASSAVKLSSVEVKRASKVDLKTVTAKVGSRANPPTLKTPGQDRSGPANGKRAAPRKEVVPPADGGKRSAAGPVKVAVVLKAIRGKSSSLKPADRSSVAVRRTLSSSTSSLGSEAVVEGPLDSPRKAVQDVPGAEAKHPTDTSTRRGRGEAAVTEKPQSHSRKVSSKLGPNTRSQGRGSRAEKGPPPGSGTGPPGQGSPGPRQAQTDSSTVVEGAGSGQSQGIPKPRTTAALSPANHPSASVGSAGRPAAPSVSKLPVKGLPTSLSSSSLGSSENNGGTNRAPAGTKPDERPSRSVLPVGSQTSAKPPSTTAPSDTAASGAPRPPPTRSRTQSLQARTSTTGLKAPTVTNHSTAKAAAAAQTAKVAQTQGLSKPTAHNPLQRSGSARLGRLSSTVDKNKPREAPARPTTTTSSSSAGGTQQQPLPPPDPVTAAVSDVVNANTPVPPGVPVPASDATNPPPGFTAAPAPGFKARSGSRSSPKAGSRLQSTFRAGAPAEPDRSASAKQSKEQVEKKNQAISQLRKLLVQGNRRVEALATVIQHLVTEREDALKQKKDLSLQLAALRGELVTSTQCCERLQTEKEEVRVGLEEASKRLERQHKEELEQLEERLRSFYQTEWDKVHQTYQEEADKYRMLMEQQVEELRSRQEAERKNQEETHSQRMESLRQQYETSIQELKTIQQTDLQSLETTLKETQTSLSEKISELSAEKLDLTEKLQAEEERRRRILSDKNLKDSHTVYLEQELESLKVVLEIKNNQLHQKEKKLMEMDKLRETNVKLEECLNKVQQENEDYKARMDKHAALSKQLSTEQAILQQTLQKESKVNKRLSMENEELLWKLHNGDLLASPRRLSPTSPFGSPRNSASFPTAAPLSPR